MVNAWKALTLARTHSRGLGSRASPDLDLAARRGRGPRMVASGHPLASTRVCVS
jgi:hypothetical protein